MSQQEVVTLIKAAAAAQRGGDARTAQLHWQAVLDLSPDQPLALNALGSYAMQRGDGVAAATLFEKAVAADPSSPDLLFNLAHARRVQRDGPGECDALERALALAPQHLGINIRLAEAFERDGRIVAATARWAMVLHLVQIGSPPPADLQPVLAHARRFIDKQNAAFGRSLDEALAERRSVLPPDERRRVDAAIDHMLGRRAIYLNQCSGLHVPFLPADEFFDPQTMPWLRELEAATSVVRAELIAELGKDQALPISFEPYVDLPVGVQAAQWSALDKSRAWSAIHLWRDGKRDDAVCARFPRTAALIDQLPLARVPQRMPTVFFSALAPRTHIPAHTGVTNARAIVHLPLIIPTGCRLRVGNETRSWREGVAFAFDDTIEHEAWNDSGAMRVVLILDTWNPHLTRTECDLICRFYEASECNELAPTLADRRWLG